MGATIKAVQTTSHRTAAADEFSLECVKFFGEAAQLFGFPQSVGQIYGLLYASPDALSFSDIFAQLRMSKGSASQGLQFLRSLGAVRVAEAIEANDRREYFFPELSLRKLLRSLLDRQAGPFARESRNRLMRLRTLADDTMGKERKFRSGRVQQLETWRRRLKAMLPLIGTLLGPNI